MENEITDKHKISLAAIMLMAPLIFFQLKNWTRDKNLTEKDKNFINWYIKYWILIDSFVIIAIFLGILNFYNSRFFWDYIISFLLSIVLIAIITWVFLIFSEKQIFTWKWNSLQYKKIKKWNTNFIFYYLPIYNFYLWYNQDIDSKKFRWIKESMLLCTIWVFIWTTPSLTVILILFYIFRVISLIAWIDFIKDWFKEKLNLLFTKNPEEIFAYIKWTIIYAAKQFKNKTKNSSKSLNFYIQKHTKEYETLTNYKNKTIISEYIIAILLILTNLSIILPSIQYKIMWWLYIIPTTLIVWRYLIMIPRKELPYLPIIHEITIGIKKLIIFLK